MNEDFDLMRMAGWGNYSQPQMSTIPTQQSIDWVNQLAAIGSQPQVPNTQLGWWDRFTGVNGQQGWGNLALGAAQGIGGLLMGMKQYGLAKDALAQSQNQFAMNYGAQRQTLNTQLEDRQRARVAATNGAAESVESYMERNRIR